MAKISLPWRTTSTASSPAWPTIGFPSTRSASATPAVRSGPTGFAWSPPMVDRVSASRLVTTHGQASVQSMRVRLARDSPRAAVPLSGHALVLGDRELGVLASQLGRAVLLVIGTLRPQLGFRLQPVIHLVSRFRAPREIHLVGSSGDGVRVGHVCTSWTAEANHR